MAAILTIALPACSSASHPASTDQPPRFIAFKQLPQVEANAARAGGHIDRGTTVTVDIPGPQSDFAARDARVYLPPAWFAPAAPRLPTLILLPGEPGGPKDWTDQGDADVIANDFARDHAGVAPIIVMPDTSGRHRGDSECVNSAKYGNVETYLVVDVPAYIRATFRAASGPNSLAVAGASAGGTCSTVLALRNPTTFATFASFSGFTTPTFRDRTIAESLPILYDGSEAGYLAHDPLTLLGQEAYPTTSAWFDAGVSDDETWAAARTLASASRQAGMQQVCLLGIPGGHTWEVWKASLTAAMPWLSGRLGLSTIPAESSAQCSQSSPSASIGGGPT